MKNGIVSIWMNLLGFERNDADCGVSRFLTQTGYKPDDVCLLLCSPDFFNLYGGMEKEYTLFPDNCAYWGIPKNKERERQPWTNFDLKKLIENLANEGIETYAGIFGTEQDNAFHDEWIFKHPEIRRHGISGTEGANGIFCLKRFSDGTYYEDFFIEKACEALSDYGFAGIHLADVFCPARGGMLHNMDFSTDYVEQFIAHSGITLPKNLLDRMGEDTANAERERSLWIYSEKREEWVRFNAWRWNVFFKKLSSGLHAIGKKVSTLGMYCSDPFETLYCTGIDMAEAVKAGVDRITANILPTSVYMAGREGRPYYFNKYMAIAPTVAAHLPKGHMTSMLGLQDATEEWSVMNDAPSLHHRDAYTVSSYSVIDSEGSRRAIDGFHLCLGDGISKEEWNGERVLLESSLSSKDTAPLSPVMLWSESANKAMLKEYIATRRYTPHKFFYELEKAGTLLSGTILPDGLSKFSGTLFVPNIDMLPESERTLVLNYNGAVICTAKSGFLIEKAAPVLSFTDKFSTIPMSAHAIGCKIDEAVLTQIEVLLSKDDSKENLSDIKNAVEFDNTLIDTLVFSKVSDGFIKALALIVKSADTCLFEVDKPTRIFKTASGAYRLYIYNTGDIHYARAFVRSRREIIKTETVTSYPVLPPRFIESANGNLHHNYNGKDLAKCSFEIKIQPGGVTVIDVYLAE